MKGLVDLSSRREDPPLTLLTLPPPPTHSSSSSSSSSVVVVAVDEPRLWVHRGGASCLGKNARGLEWPWLGNGLAIVPQEKSNNTHILGRNQQSVQFRVLYSHLFLCAAAAAGAASQPIINCAVYFSCTVHLLSSIKLVDEPKDQHHCGEGIQHREPTPVLSLSTPVLCSQLLMWQEKCEHGFGKLHFSSPSSPRDSKGKLVHSSGSWSKRAPAMD
ncbi:hypothetical protein D5F01_LYC12332 [Larimichthys crocea]|uniref:Uncharacterized protein n=1 Tax=Larimichthys crocea TaxID=215358 RepID=A0A6G0IAJ9_LARCR|nr:hypothetical protein D5F01_LYC12332 [Larimichthys crocea]